MSEVKVSIIRDHLNRNYAQSPLSLFFLCPTVVILIHATKQF